MIQQVTHERNHVGILEQFVVRAVHALLDAMVGNGLANDRRLALGKAAEICQYLARKHRAAPPVKGRALDMVDSAHAATGAASVNCKSVEHAHALRVSELPRHHRDPFDRLLIAQAQREGATLAAVRSRTAAGPSGRVRRPVCSTPRPFDRGPRG